MIVETRSGPTDISTESGEARVNEMFFNDNGSVTRTVSENGKKTESSEMGIGAYAKEMSDVLAALGEFKSTNRALVSSLADQECAFKTMTGQSQSIMVNSTH